MLRLTPNFIQFTTLIIYALTVNLQVT